MDLYKSIDKKTSGVTIKRLVKESFTCMLNQLIRDFMFKKDFFDFLQIIKRSSDDSEIKKEHLKIAKKNKVAIIPINTENNILPVPGSIYKGKNKVEIILLSPVSNFLNQKYYLLHATMLQVLL